MKHFFVVPTLSVGVVMMVRRNDGVWGSNDGFWMGGSVGGSRMVAMAVVEVAVAMMKTT